MKRKRADLKLIRVTDKKKIKVFASQSYLIFKELLTSTQRFSLKTVGHHTRRKTRKLRSQGVALW